jgi:hypothetical protein
LAADVVACHTQRKAMLKAADSGMMKTAGGKYMDVVAGDYPNVRKWVLKE